MSCSVELSIKKFYNIEARLGRFWIAYNISELWYFGDDGLI